MPTFVIAFGLRAGVYLVWYFLMGFAAVSLELGRPNLKQTTVILATIELTRYFLNVLAPFQQLIEDEQQRRKILIACVENLTGVGVLVVLARMLQHWLG